MTIQPTPSTTSTTTATSTTTKATPGALSLSLPPTTYAKLLPTNFLSAHLPSPRPSGRTPLSARSATLHTGSLTHAHGSAVVRIGDTAAVCGVRAEILKAADTNIPDDFEGGDAERIAALGLLVPNVELNTGCHPAFLPGQAPGQTAQVLVHRLLGMLRVSDLVALRELCIYEDAAEENQMADEETDTDTKQRDIKAYYTLYIDILFLSLDGSAFDTAWLAVLAALRSTKLPAARWDRDVEGVLCDPRRENYFPLSIRRCPVALSWSVFSDTKKKTNTILMDPDDFEESCCEEGGVVVVDYPDGNGDVASAEGTILRVEKFGGRFVGLQELKNVLGVARTRWSEWSVLLKGVASQ